ncbi:p10 [Phellodendron-associated higre-like virus]|uniref:P10 n=1 Tax=Phellodendron-associated higre-like virus TaxID=3022218 RepID=A0AAT9T5S5_9VIRU
MPRFVDSSRSSSLLVIAVTAFLTSVAYFMYNPGNPYNVPMAPDHVFPYGGRYSVVADFLPPSGTIWRDSSNLTVLFVCLTICVYLRYCT